MKLRRVAEVGLIVMMAFALVGSFVEVSYAASPTIRTSQGSATSGATFISFSVSPQIGDALVVFEWIGTVVNPCTFILTPSDSQSQTWGAIGNCVQDGNVGAIRAFSVASYSSAVPTTVNCNFGGPNTQIEACYIFDIASPGTITLLGSAIGSTINPHLASSVTAAPNALVLAMAGIQVACSAVTPGFGFSQIIPASACFSTPYGLSGELLQVGAGGQSTQASMLLSANVPWSELVVQIAAPTVVTTTTAFTATVIGWLAPDATHFSNAFGLLIFPLAGMVFGVMFVKVFKRFGDIGVYFSLGGLTMGTVLAVLPVNSNNVLQVPFAMIVLAAMFIFLYWWQS